MLENQVANLDQPNRRFVENVVAEETVQDLLISFFVSSLKSYRRASVCSPFPPFFLENNKKPNYQQAELYFDMIPSLEDIKSKEIRESRLSKHSERLLDWIVKPEGITLKPATRRHVEKATGLTLSKLKRPIHQLLEISYDHEHGEPAPTQNPLLLAKRRQFTEMARVHGSVYGFHGTSFENVWSIVNEGFKIKFGGRNGSLYGEGVYLSREGAISLSFIGEGKGWIHSRVGEKLACMLICEAADHPEHVKRRSEKDRQSDMPQEYIVVRDEGCVRPRFVVVFREEPEVQRARQQSRFMVVLLLYVLVLVWVFMWNSRVSDRMFVVRRPDNI